MKVRLSPLSPSNISNSSCLYALYAFNSFSGPHPFQQIPINSFFVIIIITTAIAHLVLPPVLTGHSIRNDLSVNNLLINKLSQPSRIIRCLRKKLLYRRPNFFSNLSEITVTHLFPLKPWFLYLPRLHSLVLFFTQSPSHPQTAHFV